VNCITRCSSPGAEPGANVRPSGRKCPAERAQMSGPAGTNVRPSGHGCPAERAEKQVKDRRFRTPELTAVTDPELRHTAFQMSSFV
jgi:hypothetical protein